MSFQALPASRAVHKEFRIWGHELIGIELFAGAGGLSLGAKNAGIDVKYAVEVAPATSATYRWNHPQTELIQSDIRDVSNRNFDISSTPIAVFGGPPCQGFSTSNQKTRNVSNVNNWLFVEFLRIVSEVSPELVLFENVAGITHTANGFFFRMLQENLSALGYHVEARVLDAAKMGVPQERKRFFCVGSKKKKVNLERCAKIDQSVTVFDAISDLPYLEVGNETNCMPYKQIECSDYARSLRNGAEKSNGHLVTRNAPHIVERYRYIPQGGNWKNIPETLMASYKNISRCHTGIYRRLENDKPSVVLGNFRKNMLIHPSENRGLSVREAARLQSFPDSYEFKGSIGQQQQQVGNAVPPLMAQRVFEAILGQI